MEWLAIVIGNTHIRCGYFRQKFLERVQIFRHDQLAELPVAGNEQLVVLAGVVPHLVAIVKAKCSPIELKLEDIPIAGFYATMGIDRALGAWGAVKLYQAPVLVIDCGTAISITGIDRQQQFAGGAIMAGVRLQLKSLSEGTASLPHLENGLEDVSAIPPLWAHSSPQAMLSGILHSVCAGLAEYIADWRRQFGQDTIVVLTGGDGAFFHTYLPDTQYEPNLVLLGIGQWFIDNAPVQPPP